MTFFWLCSNMGKCQKTWKKTQLVQDNPYPTIFDSRYSKRTPLQVKTRLHSVEFIVCEILVCASSVFLISFLKPGGMESARVWNTNYGAGTNLRDEPQELKFPLEQEELRDFCFFSQLQSFTAIKFSLVD